MISFLLMGADDEEVQLRECFRSLVQEGPFYSPCAYVDHALFPLERFRFRVASHVGGQVHSVGQDGIGHVLVKFRDYIPVGFQSFLVYK